MPTQVITSQTTVKRKSFEFEGHILVSKAETAEFEGNIEVTQTVPAAPTLLTATDLAKGDTIRLVWSGSAQQYNVCYQVTTPAGPFIKSNGIPVTGTTFDLGS